MLIINSKLTFIQSYISAQAMAEPSAILLVNPAFIPGNNTRVAMRPPEFEVVDGKISFISVYIRLTIF